MLWLKVYTLYTFTLTSPQPQPCLRVCAYKPVWTLA
jgi:hypothetical protein